MFFFQQHSHHVSGHLASQEMGQWDFRVFQPPEIWRLLHDQSLESFNLVHTTYGHIWFHVWYTFIYCDILKHVQEKQCILFIKYNIFFPYFSPIRYLSWHFLLSQYSSTPFPHLFFVLMFPTHDINFPIPHFCSFFPIITYNCFSHIFPIVFLAFSHFPSIFPTFSRHFPHLFGGLAPLTPPGADRQAEAAPWRRRAQGAARIGMVPGLVNIQKTMENHHAINGKTHYKYL